MKTIAKVFLFSGTVLLAAPHAAAQQQQQSGTSQLIKQEQSTGSGAAVGVSPATVRLIQQQLSKAGYDPGTVDGSWDSRTQAAVRNFQQARGLEPTGQLNRNTMQALGLTQVQRMGSSGSGQTNRQVASEAPSGENYSRGRFGTTGDTEQSGAQSGRAGDGSAVTSESSVDQD